MIYIWYFSTVSHSAAVSGNGVCMGGFPRESGCTNPLGILRGPRWFNINIIDFDRGSNICTHTNTEKLHCRIKHCTSTFTNNIWERYDKDCEKELFILITNQTSPCCHVHNSILGTWKQAILAKMLTFRYKKKNFKRPKPKCGDHFFTPMSSKNERINIFLVFFNF